MKRIVIVSDAWLPQVNGVVRTLQETVTRLRARGYQVDMVTPDLFLTVPCPGYREIRLAIAPRLGIRRMLHRMSPDIVHIATEGPLGWSARAWCKANDMPFTTAFHTRFPDYAAARTGFSPERFWPLMRRFHSSSRAVLVATQGLKDELAERGIGHTQIWSRGVDLELFHPDQTPHPDMADLKRPVMLSVGRVSVEKNIEAFLLAKSPGSKVVVGDGPMLAQLREAYPDILFLGKLSGAELASAYKAADVFVFPSRTDTFGLVMVEAMACGVPVAGYPVAGPLDVIGKDGKGPTGLYAAQVGAVDEQLESAINAALMCDPAACVAAAKTYDWEGTVDQFVAALGSTIAHPAPDTNQWRAAQYASA
jgi:glycosyltransferase involved in cell wall biosynthesis